MVVCFNFATDSSKRENSLDFAWLSKYINEATYGRIKEIESLNPETNGQGDYTPVDIF